MGGGRSTGFLSVHKPFQTQVSSVGERPSEPPKMTTCPRAASHAALWLARGVGEDCPLAEYSEAKIKKHDTAWNLISDLLLHFINDTTCSHAAHKHDLTGSRELQPCVANGFLTILAEIFNAKLMVKSAKK